MTTLENFGDSTNKFLKNKRKELNYAVEQLSQTQQETLLNTIKEATPPPTIPILQQENSEETESTTIQDLTLSEEIDKFLDFFSNSLDYIHRPPSSILTAIKANTLFAINIKTSQIVAIDTLEIEIEKLKNGEEISLKKDPS